MDSRPRLSVVVTVVDGHAAVRRCLTALAAQRDPPRMEVLVPWDDSVPEVGRLAAEFPAFRFVPMGPLRPSRGIATFSGQHELIDRRRSAGLSAATGALVGLLEDRGVPSPTWAAEAARLHESDRTVIGGAIDNGTDRRLAWAVFLCDFGKYQPPLSAGPAASVSDINVVYKRSALEATAPLWRERFHEPTVHWALQRAGHTLWLDPSLVVTQYREGLTLGGLLRERVAWGRLYGCVRARETGWPQRVALTAAAPVLPAVLYGRLLRRQSTTGSRWRRFIEASPAILMMLAAWAAGEALGYATRRPD